MQPTTEDLLRIFVSANYGGKKLLSTVTRELQNHGAAYFQFAEIEQDDLFLRLLWEQTHLMVSLGVSNPKERPLVASILGKVNLGKARAITHDKLIKSLNTTFIKDKIKFQLSPAGSINIIEFIKRVQLLKNGIYNLRLFNYVNLADEIAAFSGRYVPLPTQVVQKELDYLNTVRNEENGLMASEQELRTLLEKSLGLTGHIAIDLEDKNLGQLMEMVYYKTIAARAIILAKTKKGSLPLARKDATDYIAEVLLNDEDESKNAFKVE